MAECLEDEVLARFVARILPASDDARVRAHVDVCASCRRLLADVVASTSHVSPESEKAPPTRVDPNTVDPFVVGTIIDGKYRIDRILGTGGMGSVMAATHVELGHAVAIKVMNADAAASSDGTRRFMREGRAAAQLKSDHALRIFDVGRLPSGVPFLVMEYLEGEDLEHITRRRVPSVEEAVDWIGQAAQALTEAHERGLIHRDLKPSNLFLTRLPDGRGRIKVVDFGLVRDITLGSVNGPKAAGRLTSENMMLGSPFYMPPEQVRTPNLADARSDVWSLAATLFKVLTGHPPFMAATSHGVLAKILVDDAPRVKTLRPEVSSIVDDAVAKALSRAPDERFATVAEFAAALDGATHDAERTDVTPTSFAPPTTMLAPTVDEVVDTSPPVVAPVRPSRARAVLAIVAAFVLAAGASAALVFRSHKPPIAIAAATPPIVSSTPPPAVSSAPPPTSVAPAVSSSASSPPMRTHPPPIRKTAPVGSKCPPGDPYCW